MPNNLTIQIAVQGGAAAKAALAEIGRAVKQTATDVNDAHQSTTSAWGRLLSAFQSTKTALEPVGEQFGEIGRRMGELKNATTEMADRVFPHFKEVAAISIAAITIELGKMIAESAAAVRQTQNMAATLGLTVSDFEALRLTAARAGVDQDSFTGALSRFSRTLGTAREEQAKLTGTIGQGVTVLQGNAKALTESGLVLRGGVQGITGVVSNSVNVIRGGVKPVLDFKDGFKALGININDFADNAKGNLALFSEFSKRLIALNDSSIKAAIAQQTLGRGWRDTLPALTASAKGIDEAGKLIKQYGIGIEAAESRQAAAFNSAYTTMKFVFDRVKEMVANALGSAAIPLIEAFTNAIGENAEKLQEWATGIASAAAPAIRDLIALIGGASRTELKTDFAKTLLDWGRAMPGILATVSAAFSGLVEVLDVVAGSVNALLGTDITGKGLAVVGLIGGMTGAFTALNAAVALTVTAFKGVFAVLGVIAGAIGWPVTLLASLVALNAYLLIFGKGWDNLKAGIGGLWELIQAFSAWLWDKFLGVLNTITEAIDKALAALGRALSGGAGGGQPLPGSTFIGGGQTGGLVHGPGGVDNVPARLTAGEYVIQASSVRALGTGFLGALNAVGRGMRNFYHGGLVGAARSIVPEIASVPHYAGGGVVGTSTGVMPVPATPTWVRVDLGYGGSRFPVYAQHSVASALVQHSESERISSTGAKPSWYGGRGTV